MGEEGGGFFGGDAAVCEDFAVERFDGGHGGWERLEREERVTLGVWEAMCFPCCCCVEGFVDGS